MRSPPEPELVRPAKSQFEIDREGRSGRVAISAVDLRSAFYSNALLKSFTRRSRFAWRGICTSWMVPIERIQPSKRLRINPIRGTRASTMAISPHCIFQRGTSPIIAAAIHNGHDTREDVEKRLAITETDQLREEDPVTGEWAHIAKTQIVGLRSRSDSYLFEVDREENGTCDT